MFKLETDRLVLRPFTDADLEAFVAYRSDPEVARYQGWSLPYTTDDGRAFIEEMKGKEPGQPVGWYQLAIERKSDGRTIGDTAFAIKSSDPRQAEIGMTIARAEQSKGYGKEAGLRLLDYLFGVLKLHRVYANCDAENVAVVQGMERLGMRREAHFVENFWLNGRWGSEYWYAMLDREWIVKNK